MFVCCKCCVLSGRGLCDELITRPEESYRLWCVIACELETSRIRRPWTALGRSATKKYAVVNKSTSWNKVYHKQKVKGRNMKSRLKFSAITTNTAVLWDVMLCTPLVSDFSEISSAYIYRVENKSFSKDRGKICLLKCGNQLPEYLTPSC
jgi:hypothetical protein